MSHIKNRPWRVVGIWSITNASGCIFDGYSSQQTVEELDATEKAAIEAVNKINQHDELMTFLNLVAAGHLSREGFIDAAQRVKARVTA